MSGDRIDCIMYVQLPTELNASRAAELAAGVVVGSLGSGITPTVITPHGDIEIRNNPDYDQCAAERQPDGFLHFRQRWEFYSARDSRLEEQVTIVGRLLEWCWSQGWPAIAASDFEDLLPRRGGYRDPAAISPRPAVNSPLPR